MTETNRSLAGRILDALSTSLQPFLAEALHELVPTASWTKLLEMKDAMDGREVRKVDERDLVAQIRILTTRMPQVGYLLELDRRQARYLGEIRDFRNEWAHGSTFEIDDIRRLSDTVSRLLSSLGLDDGAEEARSILHVHEADSESSASDGVVDSETPAVVQPQFDDLGLGELSITATHQLQVNFALINWIAMSATGYGSSPGIGLIDSVVIHNDSDRTGTATLTTQLFGAQGPLSDPAEQVLELVRGENTISETGLVPDPQKFFDVEVPEAGRLEFVLTQGSETLARQVAQVSVHPPQSWSISAERFGIACELLAAWVQPQDPALTPVIDQAQEILKELTGNSALNAHQAGPERDAQIINAVFQALQDQGIRYSNPPASWHQSQTIRSPETVLRDKIGTCLDTSVLLASILEQVGMSPQICVVKGHAFVTVSAQDGGLHQSLDDATLVGQLADAGVLKVLESTAVTLERRGSLDAESRQTQSKHLGSGTPTGTFEYLTDIRAARRSGIYPLPVRRQTVDGETQVITYQPEQRDIAATWRDSKESSTAPVPQADGRVLPGRVVQWKNQLLDLSLRNHLLNFGNDRVRLPLGVPAGSVDLFEDLLNDGKTIELVPADDISPTDENLFGTGMGLPEQRRDELMLEKSKVYVKDESGAYARRLRKLATDARTELQQAGTNNLYISIGTLVWTAKDSKGGKTLRSPLILVPVTLTASGKNSTYRLTMDNAGESTPNYCLLERLWQDHQVRLPGLENLIADRFGMDVHRAFESVTSTLIEHQLDFYVEKTVDLATLQFAKFRLWKDLDENWEEFAKNPLVDHLIHRPTEVFDDPAVDPNVEPLDLDSLVTTLPVAADGTQLDAVAMSKQGRSFVIEGPPGTGKSQTITNLLAAAMSDGKRVLFVAEKSAALDVVSSRLGSVGLGQFTLDLHDKNASSVSVRRQILKSLDHHVRGDVQGHRLTEQDLQSLQRTLNRYARQLHETNSVGYSVYSARSLDLALGDDVAPMPVPLEFVAAKSEDDVEGIRHSLREVPELGDYVERVEHHPWGFASGCSPKEQPAVLAAAEAYSTARDQLMSHEFRAAAETLLDNDPDPQFVEELCYLMAHPRPIDDLKAALSREWQHQVDSALERSTQLRESETVLGTHFGWEARHDALPALIQRAEEASTSGFLGIGRRKRLLQVADTVSGGWRGDEEALTQLPTLLRSVANSAAEADQIEDSVRSLAGVSLGHHWSAFDSDAVAWLRDQATGLSELSQRWDALRHGLPQSMVEVVDQAAAGELGSFEPALRAYGEALALLKSTAGIDVETWSGWQGDLPLHRRWVETDIPRATGHAAARQLSSWTRFVRGLDPMRTHGLDEARRLLLAGRTDTERVVQSFEKGLAHASLGERLWATNLNRFPATSHERDIKRFDSKSADIRRHMEWKIPSTLLERRATFEKTHSARMGRLRREINKKSRGLSVRQLMGQLGDEVQSLMPCILVSPDSVARFFPPRAGMFDLIVFDEASQVRVADAVGAMGRGNAVIVVGDSKQMPPTSFGGATWTETDEAGDSVADADLETVTDEESILSECVQARVPRKWLSWHYRSKDESLIAFSNQTYYESKLASFPAPRYGASGPSEGGYGVGWVKVDGHFIRSKAEGSKRLRTNPEEAVAIVEEIRRRFSVARREISLGVVTFNKPQRDLIEELIRQDDDERMAQSLDSDEEGLFIKNLENVQGDERDVILFSTGFSANDKGVLPLNFGPLNLPGGERRLNVAVTRARRQVVVFSSFDPEQLRAEDTSSLGIKHLRAYLDLAKYGPQTLPAQEQAQERVDRHRDQIADAFRQEGLAVAIDVGLSDFKIDLSLADPERPNEPLVAVLLDGEEWSQRLTVGDRDGLPGQILKGNLDWPAVARIWLPEWIQSPEEVKKRVLFAYQSAVQTRQTAEREAAERTDQVRTPVAAAEPESNGQHGPSAGPDRKLASQQSAEAATDTGSPTTQVPGPDIEYEAEVGNGPVDALDADTEASVTEIATIQSTDIRDAAGSSADGNRPSTARFNAATFRPKPIKAAVIPGGGTIEDLDRIGDADVQSLVREKIAALVLHEWPIHGDRLSRVVNHSFGMKKARSARVQAVKGLIDNVQFSIDEDGFVWPRDVDRSHWYEHRTFDSDHVAVTDASPLEVANAMMLIVMRTAPLTNWDLFEKSKSQLGFGRLGSNVVEHLQRGIDVGVSSGRLQYTSIERITTSMVL